MAFKGAYPIVGREAVMSDVCRLIADAASDERGGIGFIDGDYGMGKSLLLRAVEEKSTRELPKDKVHFESVNCIESDDAIAYQPFIEILHALTDEARERNTFAKRVLAILKDVAPGLLQFIPGAGPWLAAGVKGLATVGNQALDVPNAKHWQSDWLLRQYVDGLVAIASDYAPLVLLIDDTHFIDPSSCQLICKLARRVEHCPLVILLAHGPLDSRYDSLGAKALQAVRAELLSQHQAGAWCLNNLTGADIQAYLDVRFDKKLQEPHLVEWLLALTKGNPQFVTSYLSLLEKKDVIRQEQGRYILDGTIRRTRDGWHREGKLATLDIPLDVDEVLKAIVKQLEANDRRMLEVGSIQGSQFRARLLAELLEQEERQISDKLFKLVQQRRIVSFATRDVWENARTSIFAFESILLHDALYKQLAPTERVHYHQLITEVLERYMARGSRDLHKLLMLAAYHYDLERGHMPLEAARAYYNAAELSFEKGLFMETYQLCLRGLVNARSVPEENEERDPVLAQLVLLTVASQEMRLPGPGTRATEMDLLGLLTEGEQAAKRAGDQKALAQLLYLRGRLLVVLADVPSSLLTIRKALVVARKSGDALTEMVVMTGLGIQLNKENLTEGTRMLYAAHDLYEQRLKATFIGASPPVSMGRHLLRLQMLIGLAEFDQGHFGDSLTWLGDAVDGLRRLKMRDDLLGALNFLAQLSLAIGDYEGAEAALFEAHKPFEHDDQPNAWDGYNTSVLGKLYLEWGRVEEAARKLEEGLEESEKAANRDLVTLVRNYSAEVWMQPAFAGYDPGKARRMLERNLKDSQTWGFTRSAVAALSLLGRLELLQGNLPRALEYSNQAVSLLEWKGSMPALRSEEIFFHHSVIARAVGNQPEADRYLHQAYEVLHAKACSFKHELLQRRFMTRVPLSQAIQEAVEQHRRSFAAQLGECSA